MRLSVSATTRPARPGEVEGRDYFFLDEPTFLALEHKGELLESTHLFGNRYGTPAAPVEAALAQGQDMIFELDCRGMLALKHQKPADLVSVFLLPPSLEVLEQRMQRRNQDSARVIAERMMEARSEIRQYAHYDYVVLNDVLDDAYQTLRAIVASERQRPHRQLALSKHATTLSGV